MTQSYIHTISHRRIDPPKLTAQTTLPRIVDEVFLSYNAGRLREACRLYATKMLADDSVVGLSLSGALTPAGLGISCLVPLLEAGFIDWIVSTGANLYHDTHFALGMDLHQSRPGLDDLKLREHQVIRIYDIVFDYENLLGTDRFYRTLCRGEAFQHTFGTAEFHYLVGKYLAAREDDPLTQPSPPTGGEGKQLTPSPPAGGEGKQLTPSPPTRGEGRVRGRRSLLAAAYRCGVPIFTSSPGDSSIGMNLAALQLEGCALSIDPLRDVNQSAAIVYDAKKRGRSGVLILGGGSPKNFMLQTEPQIQEVLGLPESGHDYFLQVTDARPDTGGLSGATPQEAMTWGKVDPEQLPDTVTCYLDSTVALPLLTVYALAARPPRAPRRLMERLPELMRQLEEEYRQKPKG
ncbi:MAG: deoxyhypusine synthase family protein [Gemmataceae bacterium]